MYVHVNPSFLPSCLPAFPPAFLPSFLNTPEDKVQKAEVDLRQEDVFRLVLQCDREVFNGEGLDLERRRAGAFQLRAGILFVFTTAFSRRIFSERECAPSRRIFSRAGMFKTG
jgi:hypothetical protein